MLNDGSGFKKVYLATGFTDLRRGIDGLVNITVRRSRQSGVARATCPD